MANALKSIGANLSIFGEMSRHDSPYFALLGRLIVDYAAAEMQVYTLARHLSGLGDRRARLIFGGMRYQDVVDRIRYIMAFDKTPKAQITEIESCIGQLGLIAEKRHNIVHRFVDYSNGAIHVTNVLTARFPDNPENEVFRPSDLAAMREDCACIYLRLRWLQDPSLQGKSDDVLDFVHQPWRYIRAQQDQPKEAPQKAPGSPKRQRPASRT